MTQPNVPDEVLAVISHELRNPLHTIMGYANLLLDGIGGELAPDHQEFVAEIDRAALRMQRLIDNMLDAARMNSGRFEVFPSMIPYPPLVFQTVEGWRLKWFAKEQDVKLDLQLRSFMLDIDESRIMQVLDNLLANAITFTPVGGRITVTVTHDAERNLVRTAVSDTGPGVPAHEHERIFEKFHQAVTGLDTEHPGAGLGLAIARTIIEAHGGRIGVISPPEGGSEFWFELPCPAAEKTVWLRRGLTSIAVGDA